MINQLLDIRKSESGMNSLRVAEADLGRFTEEIVLSFKDISNRRNIDLQFEKGRTPTMVWFDRMEMEKVMFNLLSNAVKFTPAGGIVRVEVSPHSDTEAMIIVSDTGSGIDPSEINLIFDRFYQVEKRRTEANTVGTGIGLSLAKTIVELHHGEIWAESTAGEGSQFFVTLLLGKDHYQAEEIYTGRPENEKVTSYVEAAELAQSVLSKQALPATPSQELSKILLVEDNADIRAYLKEQLNEEYEIFEAENGKEGLAKSLELTPDLIIADLAMPKMNGLELCEAIKSDLNTSHIPYILLTARTSLVYKVDGAEKGADDYITKPFNIQLLKARIENLLRSRKALRTHFSSGFTFSPSELVLNSLDEDFLNGIQQIVEKNIDESSFTVEVLAKELHISRMQLYRKLKALTGKSPSTVIRSIRLQRAAQLLEAGQYNVTEITYMVGYNDLKYFREQFKKEFGHSPSAYAQEKNQE